MSSTSAIRPAGMFWRMPSNISLGTSAKIGVMVAPGATQLAVIGRSPISSARLRVKERIAPFAAV
ncbi:MAG: hypothetical protein CM15mP25_6030 [Gammaproteobacteria bacterium]|nr:MAG: hypothetical protein CM15mP25_6030 [Gammaproteobacteria bacterium]